ncbi:hypothetical protein QT909_22495, partial [Xanthomonas citri pv. citri]
LGLDYQDADLRQWSRLLTAVHEPEHQVTVALVGKYIDLPDAYLSVSEALRAGGFANNAKVNLKWVASDLCDTPERGRSANSATWTPSACPEASASVAWRASWAR